MIAGLNWLDVGLTLVFLADLVLAPLRAKSWRQAVALRRIEFVVLAIFLSLISIDWALPSSTMAAVVAFLHLEADYVLWFDLIKLYLLITICIQMLRGVQRLFGKGVRPELILVASFATLVLIGTFLLVLPNSTSTGRDPISQIDALFTATSAVCVTGLVVRDTGTDFSNFGQMVIMGLFQTGGLGIITFVAFLSIFSYKTLPVSQMVALKLIINVRKYSDLKRQIIGILVIAGLIELMGAILIYLFLPGNGDTLIRIKWSLFHAISAFCNAGFALQSSSLSPYQSNAGMIIVVMGLIIVGGLGFLVIPELVSYLKNGLLHWRRFTNSRRLHLAPRPSLRVSIQTRLALRVTVGLIVLGIIGFWFLEANHILRGHRFIESLLIATFQSVTPRTAGFNTIPIDQLQDATLMLLMFLMVIGASPVSTGGGIKTVSFGILLLGIHSLILKRERVEVFGRTISQKALIAVLSVFTLHMVCLGTGVFLLTLFDPQLNYRDQLFEMTSALSTVGLSTGITAHLSAPSKLVLCAAMFIGRVGPIALMLSILHDGRSLTYALPEEEIIVG